ncbi:Beta-lactamase/transpeptidase-like protein [Mycena venus]|uniref:Beta-lactamase/transpeptidase-like protein n=1 Tax=Mycena venus TaxID=2733690 RepID=A0A8H7CHH9_9AGAR|nr:Beta-lactamase/transpeptidase-like protein [Mycena venus]
MFRGTMLHEALSSVSWQIHLLPPELNVLAHCVVALSASISVDYAIIGPGSKPASLSDRSVFSRGADLREYGIRRAPMYRALCAEALRLAFEVGVAFEPSEHNAVSCFILQFIENEKQARSRPFGMAYLSHVRAICESWVDIPDDTGLWAAYLLMEVMETTQRRQPVSVSHHDQLLITGGEPLSLQNLCVLSRGALQERKEREQLLMFAIMGPYVFHVTRVARQLYEEITGDFARRHPLKEGSMAEVTSSLTQLHSIWSFIFEHDEPETHPGDAFFCLSPDQRDRHLNIRACAFLMTFSRATLVLALHRELVRRAAITISPPSSTGHGTGAALADLWASERLTLLRRQVKDMADATLLEVARALRSMPSLPHIAHSQRDAVIAWAEFCLDEADATGSVLPVRAATMETISSALKLVGYSWQLPLGLVERLDAYVDTHRQLIPPFPEDSMFVDMFPEPLDNDWMSMFTMPLGSELFAQSQS